MELTAITFDRLLPEASCFFAKLQGKARNPTYTAQVKFGAFG